jgi:hypothetical protein
MQRDEFPHQQVVVSFPQWVAVKFPQQVEISKRCSHAKFKELYSVKHVAMSLLQRYDIL